jgi:hypothetical protein
VNANPSEAGCGYPEREMDDPVIHPVCLLGMSLVSFPCAALFIPPVDCRWAGFGNLSSALPFGADEGMTGSAPQKNRRKGE